MSPQPQDCEFRGRIETLDQKWRRGSAGSSARAAGISVGFHLVALSVYETGMHTNAYALLLTTTLFAVHPALGEQISGRVVQRRGSDWTPAATTAPT